ncbi:MAG: hypothetical protein RH949_13340 [Coleofasciculus sp. A1-SPW-01]|uniref:hypothetical protein n=1 Tax=Coleofasciculus sp. A1-SPW-01 TaxID=3070819 RepID=UPI0032FDCDE9
MLQLVSMQLPQLCHVAKEYESTEVDAMIDRSIDVCDRIFARLEVDAASGKTPISNQPLLLHQCKIENIFADDQPRWFSMTTPPPEGKLVVFFFPDAAKIENMLQIGYGLAGGFFSADDYEFDVEPAHWLHIPPYPNQEK